MNIEVKGLGKKFGKEWIFRNLDFSFQSDKSYAVTGSNGSGKSTFLQVICGFIPSSEGSIAYSTNVQSIEVEQLYQHIDIITPYLELIEELTLEEFLKFHFNFKSLQEGIGIDDFLELIYLQNDKGKLISHFSSGMKQRLKLGLGFFSKSEICFLDEPTTNLDEKGISWYLENVKRVLDKKLLIISSNQRHEYDFCDENVSIMDFKP